MGIVFRQSIKSTIAVFGGAALGAVFIFIAPHYIPKTILGTRQNLLNQGVILQCLALLGVHNMVTNFMSRYPTGSRQQKAILGFAFLVPLVAVALLVVPYFLLKPWLLHHFQPQDRPYLSRYYWLLPVLVFLSSYIALLEGYLIANMKTAIATFAREVLLRLGNFLLIILFAIGLFTIDQYLLSNILVYLLPLALLLFIAIRTKGFGFSASRKALSNAEWRSAIHFSWYHLLNGIAIQLVGFVDALMLAPLDKNGVSSVAVYSIAVFIATMLSMPYRAMSPAAFPVLNQAYLDNDMPKLGNYFRRSAINISIVSIALFVLIACNLSAVAALLPPGFKDAAPLTLILLTGRLVDVLTGMNTDVISISSHYKFLFRLSAFMLVIMVVMCRLLIPTYGYYGAAWSATTALTLYNIGKMLFLQRKFGLQPFSTGTAKALAAGAIAAVAGYFLPRVGGVYADVVVRSAVICAIYGTLILWLKPSADIQDYLASVKKNKRLF